MNEGLQLAAKFALPAYLNGSCGTGQISKEEIVSCAANGNHHSVDSIEKEFTQFLTMHPYLKIIKDIIGAKSPFEPEVVKTYWLGSDALSSTTTEYFETLLRYFVEQGFPQEHLETVRKTAPKTFVPFHLYQVLLSHFLNGGTIENLKGVNNCAVRFGVVQEISDESAEVNLISLIAEENVLSHNTAVDTVSFDKRILPKLKTGSTVAVHLKWVAEDLTENRTGATNLIHWTKEVVRVYNEEYLKRGVQRE